MSDAARLALPFLLVVVTLQGATPSRAQDSTPLRDTATTERTFLQEAVREVAPWVAAFGAGAAVVGVLDVGLAAGITALATTVASAASITLSYSVAGFAFNPPGTLGVLLATLPAMLVVGAAGVLVAVAGVALAAAAIAVRIKFG